MTEGEVRRDTGGGIPSIPADLTSSLDERFRKVAPPGAAGGGDEIQSLMEALIRWRFIPDIPSGSTRRRFRGPARLIKRFLGPLTKWQLRHLTDQLNAYAAVQGEVLRALRAEMDKRER